MAGFREYLLCLSKGESFCLEMFPKRHKTKKPRNRKPPQKHSVNQFDFNESEEEISPVSCTKEEIHTFDNHSNKILATMKIGGKEVKMLIDSGASCNVLPIKYLPKEMWLRNRVSPSKCTQSHPFQPLVKQKSP